MTIETISIKDWIESDYAKSLESEKDFEKWELFEIIPSDAAYELYVKDELILQGWTEKLSLINVVYSIGEIGPLNVENLKDEMGKTLIALRDSTLNIKLEGEAISGGKLIIQDRMPIVIEKDDDLEKDKYKIMWRGLISKIPRHLVHKPREETGK